MYRQVIVCPIEIFDFKHEFSECISIHTFLAHLQIPKIPLIWVSLFNKKNQITQIKQLNNKIKTVYLF